MNSEHWIKRLEKVECPDSTFLKAKPGLVFTGAKGALVKDSTGREYIDLCAGFGVMALGHNHSSFLEVLGGQSADFPPIVHGMGDVYPSVDKIELLETLANILPSHLTQGALALTGAGAIEIALKTCLLHKPQGKILVFEGGYHGLDLGVLPLVSRQDFKQKFSHWQVPGLVVSAPYNCDVATLEDIFNRHEIAGVFVEPIQGRAGIRAPGADWLADLRRMCTDKDALLVFDEVFTGLGRIGSITSAETVAADLICLGKSLGGGLPLSVCFATQSAFGLWPTNEGEAIHTGTFFGHPLTCRSSLAFLKELSRSNLVETSQLKGSFLKGILKDSLSSMQIVKEIRGFGMMVGIEFDKPGFGAKMMDELKDFGLITLASGEKGESLSMTPPLNIPDQLLEQAVDRLKSCLSKLD